MGAYKTLIIDLEELKDIKSGLDFVSEEMENIKDITHRIDGLIGDPEPDLKGAVNSFESSWGDNRKEVVESAKKMAKATGGVIDDWTEWDTKNAQALTKTGSDGPAPSSNGKAV